MQWPQIREAIFPPNAEEIERRRKEYKEQLQKRRSTNAARSGLNTDTNHEVDATKDGIGSTGSIGSSAIGSISEFPIPSHVSSRFADQSPDENSDEIRSWSEQKPEVIP